MLNYTSSQNKSWIKQATAAGAWPYHEAETLHEAQFNERKYFHWKAMNKR